MSELVLNEETDIVKSKKLLEDYQEANYTSKITAERGRLIRLIKKLINKLRSNPNPTEADKQKLEEAENLLNDELFKHEIQLKERYKTEFIDKDAKVPDVVTTFPKGVALQVKRLANSINEVKNAKGVKGKSIAIKNAFKDLGLLVATPIYFAGKFIIEHWYLLLLLWDLDRRKKRKDREEKEQKGREQPQEVPETVVEKELEAAHQAALEREKEKAEGIVSEPELDPSPVMAADETPAVVPSISTGRVPNIKIEESSPVLGPETEIGLAPAISSAREIKPMAVESQPELAPAISSAREIRPMAIESQPELAPAISSAREIRPMAVESQPELAPAVTSAREIRPITEAAPGVEPALSSAREMRPVVENNPAPVPVLENPEMVAELQKVDEQCSMFIGDLEDRYNFNFFVSSRHPDIKVVHSAEEFIEAAGVGTVDQAETMYRSTLPLRPIDRAIVWPEMDPDLKFFENDASLAEYIASGEEPNLTAFFEEYVRDHQTEIQAATVRIAENAEVECINGKYYIVDRSYGDPVLWEVSPTEAQRFKDTGVFSPTVGLGLSLFTIGPMSLPSFSFGGLTPVLVP